jgi:hypothetical protein
MSTQAAIGWLLVVILLEGLWQLGERLLRKKDGRTSRPSRVPIVLPTTEATEPDPETGRNPRRENGPAGPNLQARRSGKFSRSFTDG